MTRFSPSNSPSQTENGTIHEDFAKAIEPMLRYAPRHQVAIHGYCRLHNHGHWILRKQAIHGHPTIGHVWQHRFYSCVPDMPIGKPLSATSNGTPSALTWPAPPVPTLGPAPALILAVLI